ncbi:hypothetical protein [Pseudomonas sp.]|uniref:hypothetical protein n=1 Tax=Pseudomonas sp. TaxID=306 RepID=UPI003C78776A
MCSGDAYDLEQQPLAEQVLPGQQGGPELKAALRELLAQMDRAGHDINIHTLGLFLGNFVPRQTLDRAEEWQERAARRWLNEIKPALVDRLAEHFIGGDASSWLVSKPPHNDWRAPGATAPKQIQ